VTHGGFGRMQAWFLAKVGLDLDIEHQNVVRRVAKCAFGIISYIYELCQFNLLGGVVGESGVGL
jgi:hypothetical protein